MLIIFRCGVNRWNIEKKEKLPENRPFNRSVRQSTEWWMTIKRESYELNGSDSKTTKNVRKKAHTQFTSIILFAVLFSSSFFLFFFLFFCWSFLSLVRLFECTGIRKKNVIDLNRLPNETRMIHKTESTMDLVIVGMKNLKNHHG